MDFFAMLPLFFAQADQVPTPAASENNGMQYLIFLIPLLLLVWLLFMRPGKREQDQRRKLLESLDKHVKIYTVGGIVGTVHSIDREKGRIVVKVDDGNNTKIELLLDAVAGVITEEKKES